MQKKVFWDLKRNLAEKNEWTFSNQSVEVMYASTYPTYRFFGYPTQSMILW